MKIMTLDRLETHDRLLQFNQQGDQISQGCQECINNRPKEFKNHCFYIFAHTRTADDGYTKRLIWQSRLQKPKAQTNSMLFKCYPPDIINIVWMIPAREIWPQYEEGKITHSPIVMDSIRAFENNREELEKSDTNDLSDEIAADIYREIARNVRQDRMMRKLYIKPAI